MKTNKRSANSLMMGSLMTPEAEMSGHLAKELTLLGADLNPALIRNCIDLALMRKNYLQYQDFGSIRDLEKSLRQRMTTLKAVVRLADRDKHYFNHPGEEEFVERHLFVALLEKSVLVSAARNRADLRGSLTFGFHLWFLKSELKRQGVAKPVDSIAYLLQKVGFTKGFPGGWRAKSIYNRITTAQRLISKSKTLGACHEPRLIGDWHKAETPEFTKKLSGGCRRCKSAWEKVFRIEKNEKAAHEVAAAELILEYPSLKKRVLSVVRNISDMHLLSLHDRIPKRLLGIVNYIRD
ncbi:MAG: hypothetical protein KF789_10470 [Bdellovibrionaceae bacterium]|nr:hypothetical protein [Pseudobdellovibrionaceae bacterium]